MFNRPTGARAGELSRRVNFAVPDNFPAGYPQRARRLWSRLALGDAPATPSNGKSTPVNVGWTWIFVLNKR
jgi:hypothetical protein